MLSRKTTRQGDLDSASTNVRRVRPRGDSVDIAPLPTTNDVKEQLTKIASDIINVSELSTDSIKTVEEEFKRIFSEVIADTTAKLIESQKKQEIAEKEAAKVKMQNDFLAQLEPITKRISEELSVADQARMFNVIIRLAEAKLDDNQLTREFEQDSNQKERIKEIASRLSTLVFNYVMTNLSVTLTNIYNAAPDVIRPTTAALTAIYVAYNYAPLGVRSGLEKVPLLGSLFRIMNKVNPDALLIQNSVATVTGLYYLLRNAGFDVTSSIESLGAMARGATTACAVKGGEIICQAGTAGLGMMQQGVESLSIKLTNKIVELLKDMVSHDSYSQSQGSVSSGSTGITISTDSKQDSTKTSQTIKSVENLLTTPVSDGGIDLFGIDTPPSILEERIIPIVEGDTSNPIIASPVQVARDALPVMVSTPANSQSSDISELSEFSEEGINFSTNGWFFGLGYPSSTRSSSPVGGRRRKTQKRRRYKTRKYRSKRKRNTKHRARRQSRKSLT